MEYKSNEFIYYNTFYVYLITFFDVLNVLNIVLNNFFDYLITFFDVLNVLIIV